jgi:hypothetical protein
MLIEIHVPMKEKGGVKMSDEHSDIQQAVKVYKALGEPTRLKIALLLTE